MIRNARSSLVAGITLGVVAIIALPLWVIKGPSDSEVDTFLRTQNENHQWVVEYADLHAQSTKASSAWYLRPLHEDHAYYVIYTPFNMIFAEVYSRFHHVKRIEFNGPYANKAFALIKDDLNRAFPNLRYKVEE